MAVASEACYVAWYIGKLETIGMLRAVCLEGLVRTSKISETALGFEVYTTSGGYTSYGVCHS